MSFPARAFARVTQLLKSGTVRKPVWFDAVAAVPPVPVLRERRGRPARIVFPEDRLLATYYARHPEARMEALQLYGGGFRSHSAHVFVTRQLQIIRSGASDEEAYKAVEAEMKEAARKRAMEAALAQRQAVEMGAKAPTSLLEMVQAEEEVYIQMMNKAQQQQQHPSSGSSDAAAGADADGAKKETAPSRGVRSVRRG